MQFCVTPLPAKGAPRTVFALFLWLAPVMAISAPTNLSDDPGGRILSRPYLLVTGIMSLRFAEPPPPPDLTTRLPAGAPATLLTADAPPESASAAKSVTAADKPAEAGAAKAAAGASTDPTGPAERDKATAAIPPSIIPDDTRPKVKAEDFLPFFQFPGSPTNDAPVSPPPGRQPPSTATYRQQ